MVDEIVLPIVDIYLSNGCVIFVGRAHGSFPAVKQRGFVIHDREGGVFCRGSEIGGLSWGRVTSGSLEVHVPVSLGGKVAIGNGRDFPFSS